MKTQTVRLADVFLIGPLMMLAAGARPLSPWWRATLGVLGLLTVAYNGANYLRKRGGKRGA